MKIAAILAVAGLAGIASAQVSIVNNIPGSYTSIVGQSGTTAITSVSDDSEHNIVSTVGNSIFAAGNLRIGNNGVVLSGSSTGEIGFTNAAITGTSLPGLVGSAGTSATAALLPLWDDHFPSSGQSGNTIFWREDAGVLTIEWLNEDHFSAPGTGTITFQLKVFAPGAGPGGALAQYIYPDAFYTSGAAVNFAGSATIGYIGTGTNNNAQWSFNTAQPDVQGGMTTLSVVPAPGAVALLGLGGLIAGRRRR
jgi:MYXO-CTERM domain-containing protein